MPDLGREVKTNSDSEDDVEILQTPQESAEKDIQLISSQIEQSQLDSQFLNERIKTTLERSDSILKELNDKFERHQMLFTQKLTQDIEFKKQVLMKLYTNRADTLVEAIDNTVTKRIEHLESRLDELLNIILQQQGRAPKQTHEPLRKRYMFKFFVIVVVIPLVSYVILFNRR